MNINQLQRLSFLPFAAAFALFACLTGCSKEPVHDGVRLSEWVNQLGSPETTFRIQAADAIGKIGKPARADAEESLRILAANDPYAKVRVAAILALKAMGAPANEFESYLAEVTAPLDEPSPDEYTGTDIIDEAGELDENALFRGLQEDDLEFLRELENQVPDTVTTDGEVIPSDPDELKAWQDTRRKEQVESVLQQFRNPEVLAEVLSTGDPLEKRFAARLLGDKEGVSERVYEALSRAMTEQDTVLKKLAMEAIKKWTKE